VNATYLRLLFGCTLMAVACYTAWRVGDLPQRRIGVLVAICWVLTTIGEFATGRQAEPVMIGDAVFGLGLLWFAWRYNTIWLWLMICLEAALFFLHAAVYQAGQPPNAIQAVGNNILATLGLIVLVVASLLDWRRRQHAPT
jgi:hypothetical protein